MMGFCEKCHEEVQYLTKEVIKVKNIKGREVKYNAREAYCEECDEEMFVAEIRDYNLQMLDNAYRLQESLITVPEIENILEKYDIGKRPLSLLLGWGEGTLTRYINGDMPTKQYSDTLGRIFDDYNYMDEILEQNKEKITEVAYNRCRKALENFKVGLCPVMNDVGNNEKIDSVIKYLLNQCADITPLALQKLLYYCQGFYKAFTGDFLFNDDCEAWVHGPVYRSIYNKYKTYGCNQIEENPTNFPDINLTEDEQEIIDSVIMNFGCYSGKVLEKMTHIEIPWRNTRKGLSDHESSDRLIDKKLINDYFNGIKSKYEMLNISDVRDYSKDLFKKLYH